MAGAAEEEKGFIINFKFLIRVSDQYSDLLISTDQLLRDTDGCWSLPDQELPDQENREKSTTRNLK